MAQVEWNIAALAKWEELTGKPYQKLQELSADFGNASITDVTYMLICGLYGARYPDGNIEEIKKEVYALKPDQMADFFSALQEEEQAAQ